MNDRVEFKNNNIEIKNSNNAKVGNISNNDNTSSPVEDTNESTSDSLTPEVWYKKPLGLILIGVLITVIGRYIVHKFGW